MRIIRPSYRIALEVDNAFVTGKQWPVWMFRSLEARRGH